MNEFKRDRTSTCDAPRSGPIEAATPEFIVHDIVLTDRRVKASLLKSQAYHMAQ